MPHDTACRTVAAARILSGLACILSQRRSYPAQLALPYTHSNTGYDHGNPPLALRYPGQLDSESLSVSIGGSDNFKAAGRSNDFSVAIGGSGSVSAGRLEARTDNISIGGSGQATVWARQALDISIGGSGDVSDDGAPQLSQSTHGSGRVRKLGEAPN